MSKQILNYAQEGGAWIAFSTSTVSGWSSSVSSFWYTQVGKTVTLIFNISGTSNATTASFTLPVAAKAHASIYYESILTSATDNGANPTNPGKTFIDPSSNASLVTLYKDISGAGWTASGTKAMRATIMYEAA